MDIVGILLPLVVNAVNSIKPIDIVVGTHHLVWSLANSLKQVD